MLKLSVILATYNGSLYILKQLNSILSQLRKPDEVIICDDDSSDDTYDIIKNFIAENNLINWKLFKNEQNSGYRKNFYNLISKASGDIIFTCDQDDIWYPDKTEAITNIFAKYEHILAVSSSFTLIDKNDNAINKRNKNNYGLIKNSLIRPLQKISLKSVISCNISPGCTSAFRKNIADLYIQNTQFELPHDYELNILAAFINGLYFYNVPLVKYRIHENNAIGLTYKKQTRIEISEEKCSATKLISNSEKGNKIYKSFRKRDSLLKNKNLKKFLIFSVSHFYCKFFNLKARFGDFIFILKG